jgi:hypothetical protein
MWAAVDMALNNTNINIKGWQINIMCMGHHRCLLRAQVWLQVRAVRDLIYINSQCRVQRVAFGGLSGRLFLPFVVFVVTYNL